MKLNKKSEEKFYSNKKEVSKTIKNCLENPNKQNGITLIALVVTIVVLLILAGVSVNAIFSDSGIIKKAQEAQNKMDEATQNDLEKIDELNAIIGQYSGENGSGGGETPDTPS